MQTDIKEGNRLIAFFMQIPTKFKRTKFTDKSEYEVEELPDYHRDWNRLMPVVEKIEALQIVGAVVISRDHCWIQNDHEPIGEIIEADLCCKSKIDAVWKSVVAFIQWYNNNSKPTH
jgi:hypothetical protein